MSASQKVAQKAAQKAVDRAGDQNPMFGKPRAEGAGKPSQQISVLDKETNLITTYDSILAAARALNLNYRAISNYFLQNQQKPYKGRYIFKKL